MNTHPILRIVLAALTCLACGLFAPSSLADCPQIMGLNERYVDNGPWIPGHFVDIYHNNVVRMKITWRGGAQEFMVTTNPVVKAVDKRCMTASETMSIEAWCRALWDRR